jgi:hypothetical protein
VIFNDKQLPLQKKKQKDEIHNPLIDFYIQEATPILICDLLIVKITRRTKGRASRDKEATPILMGVIPTEVIFVINKMVASLSRETETFTVQVLSLLSRETGHHMLMVLNIFFFFYLFFFFLNCKIHQYRIEYNNIITYKTSYNLQGNVSVGQHVYQRTVVSVT